MQLSSHFNKRHPIGCREKIRKKKPKGGFIMQQHLEIRDNFGNRGTLTFHYKEDNPVAVTSVAMDFARMIGVLETLGNIPDNSYYKNKMDLYCWAEEFVHDKDITDAVIFFEKKLKELQEK